MRETLHGVLWVSLFAAVAIWSTERMKYEARKRTLVVLFDGTGEDRLYTNRPATNIGRFAEQVRKQRNPANVIMYHRGVATSEEHGLPFSKIPGLIAGRGLPQVVQEMYLTIVDNYKAGDEIYIVGYSRGAAAAQELAFMLDNLGVPRSSRWSVSSHPFPYSPEIVTSALISYARQAAKKMFKKMRKKKSELMDDHLPHTLDADHIPVKIRFLGLFDCVYATGSLLHLGRLPKSVEAAYHALAVDERRRHFTPTLLGDRALEVWFAGCHGNIGGGMGCTLSDITLKWMLQMARRHGLDVAPYEANLEAAEHEIDQAWNNWLVRAVGEMKPRAMPEGAIVHHSVQQMVHNTTYRPRNLPQTIRVLSPPRSGFLGKAYMQNWYTPCNVTDVPGMPLQLECGPEALLELKDPHEGTLEVLEGETTSLGRKADAVAKATDMAPSKSRRDQQDGTMVDGTEDTKEQKKEKEEKGKKEDKENKKERSKRG